MNTCIKENIRKSTATPRCNVGPQFRCEFNGNPRQFCNKLPLTQATKLRVASYATSRASAYYICIVQSRTYVYASTGKNGRHFHNNLEIAAPYPGALNKCLQGSLSSSQGPKDRGQIFIETFPLPKIGKAFFCYWM